VAILVREVVGGALTAAKQASEKVTEDEKANLRR
jgi:hypothetical protein